MPQNSTINTELENQESISNKKVKDDTVGGGGSAPTGISAVKVIQKIMGFFFVALGFAGIFLPLLPTTPFLLLAMFLFVRSSPRSSQWLIEHHILGSYICAYTSGTGMSVAMKTRIILTLWIVMGISIIFFTGILWMRIVLVIIGLGVSIHIIMFRKKPLDKPVSEDIQEINPSPRSNP